MIVSIKNSGDPSVHSVGGKGKSLIRLASADYTVPDGFVLCAEAFFRTLKDNGLHENVRERARHLDMTNFESIGGELRDVIDEMEMPDELRESLTESITRLDTNALAIRSSAISEDSKNASFAGLHESRLNVPKDREVIIRAIRDCWRSLYTNRAIVYRLQKGLSNWDGMAVVVQELVNSEVSGITLTAHPMDEEHILIESTYGFGDLVVGGQVDPDQYRVNPGNKHKPSEVIERTIGSKKRVSTTNTEGVKVQNVDESEESALSDEKIIKIANICKDIEGLFGYPQDIEWCYKSGTFYILQSRPITSDAR